MIFACRLCACANGMVVHVYNNLPSADKRMLNEDRGYLLKIGFSFLFLLCFLDAFAISHREKPVTSRKIE